MGLHIDNFVDKPELLMVLSTFSVGDKSYMLTERGRR